jgi:hypothetical protein
MHQQLQLNERPWITAEDIAVNPPLTFNDIMHGGGVSLNLKNIGHSTAIKVHPFCDVAVLKEQTLDEFENYACSKLGQQTEQDPKVSLGYMLFPGEALTWTQTIVVDEGDVAIAKAKRVMLDLTLICCVDYKFSFEPQHHQSRRAFTIGVRDPPPSLGWKGIPPIGSVSGASAIPLFGGNSAD